MIFEGQDNARNDKMGDNEDDIIWDEISFSFFQLCIFVRIKYCVCVLDAFWFAAVKQPRCFGSKPSDLILTAEINLNKKYNV
jgi:hypothetical protein